MKKVLKPTKPYLILNAFSWSLSIILICIYSVEGNRSDDLVQFALESRIIDLTKDKLQFPQYDTDSSLRRDYKLQDFMWAGSGDGPIPSEPDGGLAWEDNGEGLNDEADGLEDVILVTKTLTLFRTVLTTLVPVELSPTVILSTPVLHSSSKTVTPQTWLTTRLEPTPSLIQPTPTQTTAGATASYGVFTSPWPGEFIPTPAPDLQHEGSTNPLYWVNTVIKANGSEVLTNFGEFQGDMQTSLARVYASAFKRHLLSSLGILERTEFPKKSLKLLMEMTSQEEDIKRRRRFVPLDREREDLDLSWMFLHEGMSLSQMRSLVTTAMNVSVAIVNITSDESEPRVSMNYVVSAEGKPVPAASAVQDLTLVSKREMEDEIGYEVIKKAEALISKSVEDPPQAVASPWMIVALSTIAIVVILVLILSFIAYKWRNNRLGDSVPGQGQGVIEGGVINPAFVGPAGTGMSRAPVSSIQVQTQTERRKNGTHREVSQGGETISRRKSQQKALASELSSLLATRTEKVSPSSIKNKTRYSSDNREKSETESSSTTTQGSTQDILGPRRKSDVQKIHKRDKGHDENSSKDSSYRKRRRRKESSKHERSSERTKETRKHSSYEPSGSSHDQETLEGFGSQRPASASSREKITFGHLDAFQDSEAKVLSDDAKKIIKRHEGEGASGHPSSTYSSQGRFKKSKVEDSLLPEDQGGGSTEEDRELTEETIDERGTTRDAQVQTPTRSSKSHPRLKTRGKMKVKVPRASRSGSRTSDTLVSQGSEEIAEVHNIDDSSGDSNPMGRMRQRFHEFLDDAFNVMGKKEDDEQDGRSKSAKVSISHQIERREGHSRPRTSQGSREEKLEYVGGRPKSAGMGPPKKAWTEGSEKRVPSGRSDQGSGHGSRFGLNTTIMERDEGEESDLTSTTVPSSSRQGADQIGFPMPSSNFGPSRGLILPHYPIYPDMPIIIPEVQPGRPIDSAVPLIQAIKEEIKRFEKVKTDEQNQSDPKDRAEI